MFYTIKMRFAILFACNKRFVNIITFFCSEIDAFFRWCITSNRNFVGLFIDGDFCTIAQTKILEHHFDVKTMTTHYAY